MSDASKTIVPDKDALRFHSGNGRQIYGLVDLVWLPAPARHGSVVQERDATNLTAFPLLWS